MAVLLVLLTCSGCFGARDLVRSLEDFEVASCIYTTRVWLPFVVQRSVTATGGATVAQCHEFR